MIESTPQSRALLEKLRETTREPMTREQIFRQKVSFILGCLPSDNPATREEIEERLREREGLVKP